MIQGTGSHVGKSLIVAGLCRALKRRGIKVAPFKPQNMSNNAAVAADGGEIGRAQALQARAAGLAPSVHMNPVLLKPESDTGSQVVVSGQRRATMAAAEYQSYRRRLLPEILASFSELSRQSDIVIVEGAGSSAETNLRQNDIANMGFATAADVPVVLAGDIERGGVIAMMVGTHAVLGQRDREMIRGFIVNKFRGDPSLFDAGAATITERTGWRNMGVLPWFGNAHRLPQEDVLGLGGTKGGAAKIAVPRLNRIANFDDLDPLNAELGVSVEIVEPGQPLPTDAALVLLLGSKSTIADMIHLRAQGWDTDIVAHWRRGGRVLGLCGGYQMLGQMIFDPEGVEAAAGSPRQVAGLGLLDVRTTLTADKTTQQVEGSSHTGQSIAGYEIHLGETVGRDRDRPFAVIGDRDEGARSADGLVVGTYLHGIFSSDAFRRRFLSDLGVSGSEVKFEAGIDEALDELAAHLEAHLDIDGLLEIAAQR